MQEKIIKLGRKGAGQAREPEKGISYERGQAGETVALHYLQGQGYELLARNYRSRHGELDLVMKREHVLVFVEVKARTSFSYGQPGDWVTLQKQRRLYYTARVFLQDPDYFPCDDQRRGTARPSRPWSAWKLRFDIVEVNLRERQVRHLPNAFSPLESTGGGL